MKFLVTLKNQDPLVLNESSATSGHRGCLDYIPGSAMLGAIASSHYAEAEQQGIAWDIFHSGCVSFGNAYLVKNNQRCLPAPLSFHYPKGEPSHDSQHWVNFTQKESIGVGVQYQQLRSAFIDSQGTIQRPRKNITVKTAIDSATGTAAESQLFQYEFLEPGQTFAAVISIDETASEATAAFVKQAVNALKGQQIRLGKSRNSEFGRVDIIDVQPYKNDPNPARDTLVIWCLSDAEVVDANGVTTLAPSANDLGLATDAKLDKTRSFVRELTLSRFNQARQGFDSEQRLISKGSVLVYQLNSPLSEADCHKLSDGIGRNRAAGFGRVMINPAWAQKADLTSPFFTPITVNQAAEKPLQTPATPLIKWLSAQATVKQQVQSAHDAAQTAEYKIAECYQQARSYNRISPAHQAGPSATQWRRIQELFRQGASNWLAQCFEGDHAICKAQNDPIGWGIKWQADATGFISMSEAVKSIVAPLSSEALGLLLERITRHDLSTVKGLAHYRNDRESV